MSIISIIITESTEEIISGIPRFIELETNIPATIFYTLDGSTPTIASTIYVDPIELSTNESIIILSIYATDGTNNSPIITNTYQLNIIGPDLRTPHSGTNAQANSTPQNNLYPFGTPPVQPNQIYLGQANSGFTTDNPNLTEYSTGYNGDGYETGFTNEQLIGVPTKTQPIQYSENNAEGEQGKGIGTFPTKQISTIKAPPEQSVMGTQLFNPKALVIYQDLTKPQDPDLPAIINRANFTLEDVNHTRQGNQYFNTGLDAPPTSGSFLRSHFNPKDNTTTYYYFDNSNSRWIISKIPAPTSAITNYSNAMVFRRAEGSSGFVFQWVPFKSSYLL